MEFAHSIERSWILVRIIVSCSWKLAKVRIYEVNSSGRATIADKEIRCRGAMEI
jgi:hypothetical protein